MKKGIFKKVQDLGNKGLKSEERKREFLENLVKKLENKLVIKFREKKRIIQKENVVNI